MKCLIKICCFVLLASSGYSQGFKIKESSIFEPQKKRVVLFEDSINNNLIMFKTKLQVNTDGTPVSYHPDDLRGQEKAINTIGNAVAVYKNGHSKNLFLDKTTFSEALEVFKRFKESDYEIIPEGYTLRWKNVLIPKNINGIEKPCILQNGVYKGYYASATSLKQGLKDKGECDCENQVNPLEIPSLVLVGGNDNVMKKYGAGLGDLLIAFNPTNNKLVYAIINDSGPKTNLGEGSVLLNMMLMGKTEFPKTISDTYKLATSNNIIIAVIPNSKHFNPQQPFTAENIKVRILEWFKKVGFTESKFLEFLSNNNAQL